MATTSESTVCDPTVDTGCTGITMCDPTADPTCVPVPCDPSIVVDGTCMDTSDMPPIEEMPPFKGPPMNPIVYAFALAPIVDILGGYWNYDEYNTLTTSLYSDW